MSSVTRCFFTGYLNADPTWKSRESKPRKKSQNKIKKRGQPLRDSNKSARFCPQHSNTYLQVMMLKIGLKGVFFCLSFLLCCGILPRSPYSYTQPH